MNTEKNHQTPVLSINYADKLNTLEQVILDKQVQIERWFRTGWEQTPPPWMASVDLRNAGFKLAPVDTNLFPAGFNNLSPKVLPLCVQAMQATFMQKFSGCERVLLIPENHTRNYFYLESLARLQKIIEQAGFEVRIASLLPDLQAPLEIDLPSGESLKLEPLIRVGDQVGVDGFIPCLVLLNHDLSEGIPDLLKNCKQRIEPPFYMGWATRLKSGHFEHYAQVADEFAAYVGIDSWWINPLFRQCGEINFLTRQGEECLAKQIDELLNEIRQKYEANGINSTPFVMVKADAGTYGMGIMTVTDPEQIFNLNRKERSRMSVAKGKQNINKVIIQEGVHTFETWGEAKSTAEPVIYMIGQHVVGGFYRIHKDRGIQENLNAPGMHFEPLAFDEPCNSPDSQRGLSDCQNRFYVYGVIARLALLAASREVSEGAA